QSQWRHGCQRWRLWSSNVHQRRRPFYAPGSSTLIVALGGSAAAFVIPKRLGFASNVKVVYDCRRMRPNSTKIRKSREETDAHAGGYWAWPFRNPWEPLGWEW